MAEAITSVEIRKNVDREVFLNDIKPKARPVIMKGLVADWPAVQKARLSDTALIDYIAGFYNGVPAPLFEGAPEINGRFAYNDDITGFNFKSSRAPLSDLLDWLKANLNAGNPPSKYAGSLSVSTYIPDFAKENSIASFIPAAASIESIWIGNRTCIAPHYDNPENIACVVGGARRFTLFPIEQMKNLYIGPPDMTPAGQIISLVDTRAPDLEKFPRYADAQKAAMVAELEPGDALYIPSLWWHGVESLSPLGVLVNYWWLDAPDYFAPPMHTLLHALLSLKDLPPHQRDAWKTVFDHLIFATDGDPLAHLPEAVRGAYGGLTPEVAAYVRTYLARSLR
ncbi:hypothetical protein AEAC466_01015 [Asticcacaulis sp. AC466]|uniref:cupin-like domain-containing protein n=1 Tax=Asticcacaulis sp. AC466 TaxID=1282362 RepID=UPI0003C40789|nr:cupin-like domain-containing protein [Asticcacaulis sp. AC466]ESQ85786.1 hypothetical protein AEAC466_01015 [Asticcacaulis sp. AC466]